jgi:hypothetical protein
VTLAASASCPEIRSRSVVSEPGFGIKGWSMAQKLCLGKEQQASNIGNLFFCHACHANVQKKFQTAPKPCPVISWDIGCPDAVQSTVFCSNHVLSAMNPKAASDCRSFVHSSSVGNFYLLAKLVITTAVEKTLQRSVPGTTADDHQLLTSSESAKEAST